MPRGPQQNILPLYTVLFITLYYSSVLVQMLAYWNVALLMTAAHVTSMLHVWHTCWLGLVLAFPISPQPFNSI